MPTLEKAKLQPINGDKNPEPIGDAVDVQFNPASLHFALQSASDTGKSTGNQAVQHVGSGDLTISLDLHFDSADEGTTDTPVNVRTKTKEVAKFMLPTPGSSKPPPRIRFHWGDFVLDGVMASYSEDVDLFSPQGVPLRAKVSISIRGQNPDLAANKAGPGAATGSGATPPGSVGGAPGTVGFGASLSVGASLGLAGGLALGGGVGIGVGVARAQPRRPHGHRHRRGERGRVRGSDGRRPVGLAGDRRRPRLHAVARRRGRDRLLQRPVRERGRRGSRGHRVRRLGVGGGIRRARRRDGGAAAQRRRSRHVVRHGAGRRRGRPGRGLDGAGREHDGSGRRREAGLRAPGSAGGGRRRRRADAAGRPPAANAAARGRAAGRRRAAAVAACPASAARGRAGHVLRLRRPPAAGARRRGGEPGRRARRGGRRRGPRASCRRGSGDAGPDAGPLAGACAGGRPPRRRLARRTSGLPLRLRRLLGGRLRRAEEGADARPGRRADDGRDRRGRERRGLRRGSPVAGGPVRSWEQLDAARAARERLERDSERTRAEAYGD